MGDFSISITSHLFYYEHITLTTRRKKNGVKKKKPYLYLKTMFSV